MSLRFFYPANTWFKQLALVAAVAIGVNGLAFVWDISDPGTSVFVTFLGICGSVIFENFHVIASGYRFAQVGKSSVLVNISTAIGAILVCQRSSMMIYNTYVIYVGLFTDFDMMLDNISAFLNLSYGVVMDIILMKQIYDMAKKSGGTGSPPVVVAVTFAVIADVIVQMLGTVRPDYESVLSWHCMACARFITALLIADGIKETGKTSMASTSIRQSAVSKVKSQGTAI
ncbi:hypothetical protein HDU83_005689 [Entophlyctis luteolus]|nr:hypothetical protein HDU83_005689 [Entophlyctis luteolus]